MHPDLLEQLFVARYKQKIEDNAIATYHDTEAIWWPSGTSFNTWCKFDNTNLTILSTAKFKAYPEKAHT